MCIGDGFYNAAISRTGCADVAAEVQRRWVDGDKAGAAEAVTDELALLAYPIGTEDMVKDRIRAYRAAGINGLRISPRGSTPSDRIADLERTVDLIRRAVGV